MTIRLADAIDKLAEINEVLQSPHLLIGGLSVERYWPGRDSYDIDLFCSYNTGKTIINTVFPSRDWDFVSETGDPRHPKYIFTKKNTDPPVEVVFDPRYLENDPYASIAWNTVKTFSHPYPYGSDMLSKILIPSAGALAFLKLVSYTQRPPDRTDKRRQDLQDVVDLTNHKLFKELDLVACLYSSGLADLLRGALLEDAAALAALQKSTRCQTLESILQMGNSVQATALSTDIAAVRELRSPPKMSEKSPPRPSGMTQIVAEIA